METLLLRNGKSGSSEHREASGVCGDGHMAPGLKQPLLAAFGGLQCLRAAGQGCLGLGQPAAGREATAGTPPVNHMRLGAASALLGLP